MGLSRMLLCSNLPFLGLLTIATELISTIKVDFESLHINIIVVAFIISFEKVIFEGD
jgi:hypothetical protein